MEYLQISITDLILHYDGKYLGEMCYQMRKALSSSKGEPLIEKQFFADFLDCDVNELAQIESGVSTNVNLTQRYFIMLRKCLTVFKDV